MARADNWVVSRKFTYATLAMHRPPPEDVRPIDSYPAITENGIRLYLRLCLNLK